MARDFVRTDIPQLAKLYKLFWNEESNTEKMYIMFDSIQLNQFYTVLGYFSDDNVLIGSVMGIICQDLYGECKPFMVIESMVVDVNMRKKGIAKKLLSELEKRAAAAGCSQIILVTEKVRTDACGFYESMGFSKDNAGYKKKNKCCLIVPVINSSLLGLKCRRIN